MAAERRWILTFVRMTETREEPAGLANVVSGQGKNLLPATPAPPPSSRRRPGSSVFGRASMAA